MVDIAAQSLLKCGISTTFHVGTGAVQCHVDLLFQPTRIIKHLAKRKFGFLAVIFTLAPMVLVKVTKSTPDSLPSALSTVNQVIVRERRVA